MTLMSVFSYWLCEVGVFIYPYQTAMVWIGSWGSSKFKSSYQPISFIKHFFAAITFFYVVAEFIVIYCLFVCLICELDHQSIFYMWFHKFLAKLFWGFKTNVKPKSKFARLSLSSKFRVQVLFSFASFEIARFKCSLNSTLNCSLWCLKH